MPNNAPLELNQDSETTGNLDGSETRGEADARAPEAFLEDPNAPRLEPEFVMNQVELLPLNEGLTSTVMVNRITLSLLFSDPVVGNALGGDPNSIARTVRRGEMLLLIFVTSMILVRPKSPFRYFLGQIWMTGDEITSAAMLSFSLLPA